MRFSGFNRDDRPFLDRRDAELERLKKECDELRTRERRARAEAEEAHERLSRLTTMSKTFASSIRGKAEERRRSRRRLTAQHAVTRVLSGANDLEEAAPRILKILGDELGWELGVLWLVDEEAGVLRCDGVWRSSGSPPGAFETACRQTSFRRGEELPGRAWARGRAAWVEDALADGSSLRVRAAAGEGLRGALAFPIQNRDTLGVFEFFGRKVPPPDEDLLLLATVVGGQIGQFIERRRAREALRRGEERYRSLVTATSSMVWTAAAGGESVEEMPSWQRFTGQTPAQYGGFGWLEAVHPEDRPPAGAWKSLLKDKTPVEAEYRLMRHDGQYRRVVLRGVPILDKAGEIREWVGTITDVEDERRAEEERERLAREVASERARFEAVLQQMPAGVVIADVSGELILSNEEAARVYGRSIGSVEECGRDTYSYPDGRELPPEHNPLNRSLARGEVVSGEEHYVRRLDGTTVVVSVNSAPVRDEEGRTVAVVKSFLDVTWRKEAEAALKEGEERLRAVVEGAPVILFALDREGVITLSAGRVLEALGLKPGELVGTSAFDFHADRPEALEHVRRALAGEALATNIQVDGLVFDILYSPLRDARGEVAGVIVVGTDVTERKKAQEERDRFLVREWRARAEAEERKRISRELHDRVAHSMAVVHQSLELYEAMRERNPEQAGYKLNLAREMTKVSLESTRDLSMTLRNEVEDGLAPALSHLLSSTVPDPEARTGLSVEGDESLVPLEVRDQMFLILREGVRNAVSHSGVSRITVSVEITPERVSGFVEDDGRGFDPQEVLPHASNGLRSMKERAALVGGILGISSEPDEGARVEITVPLSREV